MTMCRKDGDWVAITSFESTLFAVLAVVPVQKEQRERAHDKEEEDPHSEACVVFDRLERKKKTFCILDFLTKEHTYFLTATFIIP